LEFGAACLDSRPGVADRGSLISRKNACVLA
jgi:hypothetical protein